MPNWLPLLTLLSFSPLLAVAQCFISADIVPSLPPYSALCPGETLTVTANPFGGTPPYTYQWSNGQTTQSIVVANPGLMGANFNVTITDDNGCIGIDFAHLKYLEWSANITIGFGNYCLGESTPLTAEIFPYYSSTTFAWSTGETSQSISINANGNYSVTITSPDMPCPFVTNTIEVNSFVNAVAPDPGITGTTSLCPGQNGVLNATGGPFATYVWAPTYASDTETLPITDPGVYTLYVTNDAGCEGEATFEVLGGGVAPELNMPDPVCAGQSTTLEVTNPSSFTSFNWSNGASGPSISVSTPGTYTVTVSAGGSCSATGSVEVTSSGTSISLSGSTTANSSCTAANGEINLSSSPAGSYDYNWSNGETTEDLTGIAEGTYIVTVTEPGGCSATASFAVAVNTSPPVASANPTPAFCSQPTGSIDLNMSPPGSYTFEWSNGSTTEDLTNIAVGTYSVTATSTATGCSATSSSMVGNTSIAITVSGNVTDPSNGISNGAIDLSASPAGNYDYAWSNGATTEDLTGLGEGTYVVTVSEGSCTGTASFTLVGAACDMTVNIASSVPSPGVVCVGDDVTILANVSGGTAPYTYAWSNGATTPSFTVPAPISQTYVLVVTDDDGCTALATSHIKINVWYVDINYSQVPTCQGETLTLIASTTAEIPGTTYTWSTGQTGFMIEVASSGTYSVSMTHPNVNCTAEASVMVTVGNGPAPNPQITGPATLCAGQSATLNVNGGPFSTYTWSDGSTDPTLSITDPGTYSIIVTNAEGCTGTDFIEVQTSGATPLPNSPAPICPGQSTTVEVTNPGEFLSFQWSNGGIGPSISVSNPGTYTVTATAAGGCTATASADVLSNGSNISVSGVASPVTSCTNPNGEVDITASPAGAYTYNWSNGEMTEDLTGIAEGTYTVTVTDGGGCTASASFTITNNTASPSAILNPTAATCGQSNGAVDLSLSPPGSYTFAWSNGEATEDLANMTSGNYSVTATNTATGCSTTGSATVSDNGSVPTITGTASPNTSCTASNGSVSITASPAGTYDFVWSNGDATEDISGLAAGNYMVTVSVGGACSATASFNVLEATNLPSLTANVVAAVCGNPVGSIDLTVAPAGSYTFAWSSGASTEDLTDLPPGDYSVSVTATATGCSATDTYNVPNNSNNFSLSGSAMPVTNCGAANGNIDLSISPSGTYAILWSNGATSEDLLNIAAGNYTVTVTQGGACTASASFIVDSQVNQPQLSQSTSPASCGQADGGIDLTASPAGIYTYSWSNGATTEDLTGIASGNYSVTVSATNGCTATTTATVAENTVSIALTGNATANSSCTASNGGIDLSASPTGTYSFIWSNGVTSEDLQNIAAGSYTVTVSAGGNCSATATYTVLNNSGAPSLGIVTDAAACGLSNGGVNLTTSPAATYAYLWSNGATSEDLTGIAPGSYIVTVTGANGCFAISSAVVLDGPASFTPSGIVTPVSSCTAADGSIDLSVTPTGSYGFLWSNGQATEDLTGLAAGNYLVTISLGTTCSTTASYVVTGGGDAPVVSQINTPAACGQSNGSIDLSVSPANGSSFIWSNGATTEDLQNIAAGTYAVTCTGANGCTATLSATVANTNSNISLSATSTASTSCVSANGEINLSASPSGVYIYLWSNGATSEDLTGIAAGTYSVTATDANGCSTTVSVTVDGTAQPQVALSGPAEVCAGSFTTLAASPGFVSYLWSNGQAANSITVSQPGDYSVTATDAGGCTAIATHNIAQLPAPAPVIEGPSTSCGGSTEFTVAGGVFTQFIWNTGATTPSITVSLSGDYSVTVTDASGCTGFDVATLSFGTSLLPAIVSDAGTCDGTATLDAGPGYASYLWSNGATTQNINVSNAATYTVTVSDGSGCTGEDAISVSIPNPPQVAIMGASSICQGSTTTLSVPAIFTQINWSTGASTASITASQPITYNVTVTDANGCTATDALTLTVGSSLSPDITATLTDCNGTSSLDAGTGFASYLWSNGATTPSITVIAGGSYLVTVSDASGCTGTAVENYVPPTPPTVQVLGASAHCEGDFSVLVAEGDFLGYLWSTGQTSQEIMVMLGGDYSVTVSDANGCTAAGNWTITPIAPSLTALTATSCSVQDTGTVELTLTNQFGCDSVVVTTTLLEPAILTSLSFEACAGESVSFNGESIPAGGSQEFVFAGANGCDSIVVVNVQAYPLVNYELEATKTCWNSADGSIEVTMLSGKEPYHFSLDGGEFQLGPAFTGVPGGTHAVMVEDANGCVQELDIQVPQQGPSQLEVEDVTIHCEAEKAMLQAVLVSENPADAIWLWSDGSTQPMLEVKDAGKYTVQVDDGCEVLERVAEVKLDERYFTTDFFYVPNTFSPNGDGINDEFRAFPVPGFEVQSFELRVFDRWGDEQFVSFDPEAGWDGIVRETERQPAVHVWFVKATVAGCGGQVKNVYREGGVTIMR
ncbi:MAG: gliding motility-associated C-terminal domain-containing protein [Saprospiraceae bacterium]|nr:gliding motility-associated C-terminal domain-containing protein [Saprospiraceae bacterium]